MTEFELIKHYFARQQLHRPDVSREIGDDAAIVSPPAGHDLAMTTDTLIAGVHFPENANPYDIGHKALAVNLSDLAAMGATPAWVLLSITLPQSNEEWVREFCAGFFNLARPYQVQLIGGDVTRASLLSITVQATGFIPHHQALLRSTAKTHDLIYVSGTLGDAGLALRFLHNQIAIDTSMQNQILQRLHRPEPRIHLGEQLRQIAHAAIDISDGLAADLQHILEESQKGAIVYVEKLPLSPALKQMVSPQEAIQLALTAGDDYELCFTVAPDKSHLIEKIMHDTGCHCTCIGEIIAQPGLNLRYQDGSEYHGTVFGYQHF